MAVLNTDLMEHLEMALEMTGDRKTKAYINMAIARLKMLRPAELDQAIRDAETTADEHRPGHERG